MYACNFSQFGMVMSAMMSEDLLIARVLQKTNVPQASHPQRSATPDKAKASSPAAPHAKAASAPREKSRELAHIMPGFGAKARIQTSFGALPVEALRKRDEVRTAQGRFMRVAHVDKMHLDADFLFRHAATRPILIKASALGRGMPGADVIVSPSQMISTSKMPQLSACKKASALTHLPGVTQTPCELVSYFNFHCGSQELIQIEGLWMLTAP